MNPYKLSQVYKQLTSQNSILKKYLKLGTKDLKQPDLPAFVETKNAVNRFVRDNPRPDQLGRKDMAGGGMLVQPSADGSRPGYAGKATIKTRNYLETLPKNSDIVVLDIAKDLEVDRGVVDNVLKEKKFKNKNFRKLRKAGFLTNEDFVKEYKNYQNSDVFKTGEDSEFAKYLNDKGFKAETKSGEFTSKSVNVRRKRLNVKSVSPVALRLSDKDILKEAKRFNIDTKNLNPEELREKVLNKRTRENVVKRMQEDPEFADRIRKEAIQRAKKRYTKLKSTEEGRGILKEQRIKTKAKEYQIKGLDPPASTAKELLWKDVVKIAKDDGRFTIQSGYEKSMKKDNFYSNKIKIKDSVTGKTFTFNTLENFVNKNASSFNVKNFNEVMKPYKQKQYINDKGLRNILNEALIPGWSSGDPRTAYTIQHDFGRLNNPFKVSLAFYDDNTKEYKIRSDFEKAWEKSKTSKTPLADRKLAFQVFKEDIDRLNIRSSPSMITRDRAFGKELDLESILKKAKKEGAVFKRGTLKEAAEFDNLLAKIGCPGFQAADGGRATFDVGTNCQMKGADLINSGMKNASPAQLKNFAAFANRARGLGRGLMKFGIIPEAMYVAADSAIRLTMGDKPIEALLRASEYLLPGDQTKLAEMMEAKRLMNPETAAIIGRSLDYKNQLAKIQSLEDQRDNLENLSSVSEFDYMGDLTGDVNNLNNQIKQATNALNTKFKMTDAELAYANAMQDEVDDIRKSKSLLTKIKSIAQGIGDREYGDVETLGVPEKTQEQLNKRLADLLPRDLLLATEEEMIRAAKNAQAQGYDIPDDYYIKEKLKTKNLVQNMSLAELAAATSPEQVYGTQGHLGEPLNKGVVERPQNVIGDMEREITGQTNVANPFDIDLSMMGSGLRGFSAAGGGIAKEAGVDSGAPPESGPNPQGLSYLMKRGKNI